MNAVLIGLWPPHTLDAPEGRRPVVPGQFGVLDVFLLDLAAVRQIANEQGVITGR